MAVGHIDLDMWSGSLADPARLDSDWFMNDFDHPQQMHTTIINM